MVLEAGAIGLLLVGFRLFGDTVPYLLVLVHLLASLKRTIKYKTIEPSRLCLLVIDFGGVGTPLRGG